MRFLTGKGNDKGDARRSTTRRAPAVRVKSPPVTRAAAAPVKPRTGKPAGREEVTFDPRRRLEWVVGFFMLGFAILAVRAVDLAVLQGDKLKGKAQDQHRKKVVVQANRGRILDRQGRTLAISVPVRTASLDRDRIADPVAFARKVGPLLGMDAKGLAKKIQGFRAGSFPVIKRQVPPDVADRIKDLKEPGIYFLPDVQRFYPLGEVTAHILGFVDMEGHGVEGMEKSFESHLRGKPGLQMISRDRLGQPMAEMRILRPAEHGADLSLTIDAAIQYIAYRALVKAVVENKAKAGTVMVMDPNNGQILAMVNQPGFNPNNLGDSTADMRRNRAVTDAYEPGSTFKMFTIAAALDKGVITPNSTYHGEFGRYRVKDRIVRDHKPHGVLSVREVLKKSSNIASAKIGLEMGEAAQREYLVRLGFGRPSGIELSAEAGGRLPDISGYLEVGLANRSFGQGISTTPLQVLAATGAVMNGGFYYPPRIVLGKSRDGLFQPAARVEPELVFQPKNANLIRDMLKDVVTADGTAPQAAVEGYAVSGKTGTAQKAIPGLGYVAHRYFASFVGAVPADRPRLVIFVGIDEPAGRSYYGGEVAGPVFREIASEALPIINELPGHTPLPALPPLREAQAGGSASPTGGRALLTALEGWHGQGVVPRLDGVGWVDKEVKETDGSVRLVMK